MTFVKVLGPRRSSAISRLENNIEDMLSSIFDDSIFKSDANVWRPAMNAQELESEYIFTYSLPGFEKDEIHVSTKDKTLTVRAAKKVEEENNTENFLHREIGRGSFERTVALSDNAKLDKIAAEYRNGVLKLTIPKTEEALPREIEVKVK